MQHTINMIVQASQLPLSIVIVGIGKGSDFEGMKELDGDNTLLKDSSGNYALRDIV